MKLNAQRSPCGRHPGRRPGVHPLGPTFEKNRRAESLDFTGMGLRGKAQNRFALLERQFF